MLPKKYQKGFVDPLSLFAIGFLVISLIVGTKIVTDRQRSLDIREEAKMIADCSSDSDCGSGYKCIGGFCEKIPTTTTTETITESSTDDDRLTQKETSLDPDVPDPAPQTDCIANGKCVGPGEDCCGGSYFDNSCYLTESRCGTKSTSTSTSSPTLPTSTPSPTLKSVGYFCTSNDECASGYCTYSPGGDKWCQEKPAAITSESTDLTPEEERLAELEEQLEPEIISEPVPPYCTTYMARVCTYGCEPNTLGGSCKSAPAVTETTLKTDGQVCSRDNECQSGKCQYASFGLNRCIAVLTEEEQQQQKEETLIAAGQFLNTITFGAFGDYVSTYADVNTQQPESTYLEKSFSREGLASSAKLGAILTAEGAALYFGGMALGGASLAEIPISTTFGIPGITQTTLYGAAVAESVLSAAPQWVPGLIKTTGVVLGNYGVYQGTKACQNDPGSLECTMLITGIQMGWLDDLARETGAFLEDAYEATTFMAVQSLEDAQVAYSIDPNMRRLMNMSSEDPLMAAVDDVPSFVTLESGEVITVGEQVGSSGAQGSAYLGQTCTGETCIVKLFDLDDIPEGFTEEALNQINSIQIEIMSTFGTAENTFLPQYYGSVVDESGEAVGYAMEYISGTTASDVIQAQGGLTYEQANEIFDAVYSFQETTGLPHGDITNFGAGGTNLSNVIFNAEGKAVLIDPVGSSMIINSLPTKEIIDSELYYLRNWIENSILE
jgi:hypothetical protein